MDRKVYDKYNGRTAYMYTIKNEYISVDICDLGARINSLKVFGTDIVLGFDSIAEYLKSGCFAGATIGRCANRIKAGKFSIGDKEYSLNLNEGKNHLHGGTEGFDKKFFEVVEAESDKLVLKYESPDGEENYPGNLKLIATFTLDKSSLNIEYNAVSDKDTVWNPTNHAYFNLNGEGEESCINNLLQINGDFYTPTDGELIPTGAVTFVGDTPFDFRAAKPINYDFGNEALCATNGYDHNYILNGRDAAYAIGEKSGIKMEVSTDLPCLQFYSGGALKTCRGKTRVYGHWSGFCLEPQYCPNAVNMNGFDKPLLKAGESKSHYIRYDFHHEK